MLFLNSQWYLVALFFNSVYNIMRINGDNEKFQR